MILLLEVISLFAIIVRVTLIIQVMVLNLYVIQMVMRGGVQIMMILKAIVITQNLINI